MRRMELIHTCYRIGDIDRSVTFYQALGFEEVGRAPIRDEAINVFMGLPGDGPRLELTYNFGVDSYDLGTGYNHVAVTVRDLEVQSIHTPGHTEGMLALLVDGQDVFTGDTLFKGSVGGVRAPGHTTYEDLRESIMEHLLTLSPQTQVHPGHTDPTTVADEWEGNPFVRVWRGLDPEGAGPCVALGESATLVLMAPDYDGGHKAWVRWPDGADDIVPGSQVTRA